jgi:hypothetical protein
VDWIVGICFLYGLITVVWSIRRTCLTTSELIRYYLGCSIVAVWLIGVLD